MQRFLALDSETEHFAPGNMAPHLICVSWFNGTESGLIHWKDAEKKLISIFNRCSPEAPLVFHNGAFDLWVLAEQFPSLLPLIYRACDEGSIQDTLLREKLYDISIGDLKIQKGSYSLGTLAHKYCDMVLDKDTWRMRYGEFKHVPLDQWPEDAKKYPIKDAIATGKVYLEQQQLMDFCDIPNQIRGAVGIRRMQNNGMMTDEAFTEQAKIETQKRIEDLRALLQKNSFLKPNGSRTMKIIYDYILSLDPSCKKTATGKPSTTIEDLEKYNDECLNALGEYGNLQKLFTEKTEEELDDKKSFTFQVIKEGYHKPIHAEFSSIITTGRTSSRKPNFQNVAKSGFIKGCFVPRPGNCFISADFTAAELHTLAQTNIDIFGYSEMGRMLNEGIDLHCTFGANITGLSYEEFVKRNDKEEPFIVNARQLAKIYNFGAGGGMGARRMAENCKEKGFDIDERTAKRYLDLWKDTYPEMKEFFKYIKASFPEYGQTGTIVLPRSGRTKGGSTYTDACNYMFQGPAGDATKEALYEVTRECYLNQSSILYGCLPVNFVHDSILLEAKIEKAEEIKPEFIKVMLKGFNKWTPDVPCKVKAVIMLDRWH